MKIGIITAMSSEFDLIATLLEGREEISEGILSVTKGEIANNSIILIQSGIGKVNSAIKCAELIARHAPDCIISTGVAGGIDQSLNVMDVVASRSCCYHDVWCGEGNELGQVQGLPTRFTSHDTLYNSATKLNATIHGGLICSGDQFITNRAELDKIKGAHPEALAVDMESCSIAQCCYLYNMPFLSLRVISDTPGADGHQQQYENFWGEIANRSFTTVEQFLKSLPTNL